CGEQSLNPPRQIQIEAIAEHAPNALIFPESVGVLIRAVDGYDLSRRGKPAMLHRACHGKYRSAVVRPDFQDAGAWQLRHEPRQKKIVRAWCINERPFPMGRAVAAAG
ncbi:MAG: hypothetical protein ACREJM_09190, partial [Candidatus Saccharimonadales bacterium]